MIKNSFLRQGATNSESLPSGSQNPNANSDDTSSPLTYAHNLKVSLYYESPDGFGDWRIYLARMAEKDLRKIRKGDAKAFEVVWKKLA